MSQPISGSGSSYPHQPESSKKTENISQLIMEIEDTLQTKYNHGEISLPQFITLSKRLEGIQEQFKGNEAKEEKKNEEAVRSLKQLKGEIQTISGQEPGQGSTGGDVSTK